MVHAIVAGLVAGLVVVIGAPTVRAVAHGFDLWASYRHDKHPLTWREAMGCAFRAWGRL